MMEYKKLNDKEEDLTSNSDVCSEEEERKERMKKSDSLENLIESEEESEDSDEGIR